MSTNSVLFLGRQPIVDKDSQLIGYELFYRNKSGTSDMKSEQKATAAVLTHTLSLSGIDSIIGEHLGFVNVDAGFLKHDMILSIPAERFVLELNISSNEDEAFFERVKELHKKGYVFAFCIDNVTKTTIDDAKRMDPYIEYIKLNTLVVKQEQLFKILLTLGSSQKTLIATHIETKEHYESFLEMGFSLFQGYFFAKPEMISSTQGSTDSTMVISLCNLLTTDASMEEVVSGFSSVPMVSMHFHQYINSCAFSFRNPVDSIERMISLLGRKPLMQWLFLTLYASSEDTGENNALLLMVQQRTQLIVDLLRVVKPEVSKDEISKAYFVGLLSLMHLIVKQPLDVFLDSLHLDPCIKEALLKSEGLLGELYAVAIAIEEFDLAKTEEFIVRYEIEPASFQKFLFRSFESANTFKIGT